MPSAGTVAVRDVMGNGKDAVKLGLVVVPVGKQFSLLPLSLTVGCCRLWQALIVNLWSAGQAGGASALTDQRPCSQWIVLVCTWR